MRIVLEKDDIVQLLGKALGSELDVDSLRITTDPFEITIAKAEKILKEEKKEPQVSKSLNETEPSMDDLLAKSESMVQEKPRTSRQGDSFSPPPTVGGFEQEQ